MMPRKGNIFWTIALFAASGTMAMAADTPAAAPSAPSSSANVAPGSSARPKLDPDTNGVAAIVNGKIITLADLDKKRKPLLDRLKDSIEARYPDTPEGNKAGFEEFVKQGNALSAEILHSMVDHILIVEEFRAKGYTFPQSYLDWKFDDSITTRFQGDHEKYLRYLTAWNMTEADYRRDLEEGDIEGSMIQQLHKSVTGISPDRIKAYYEKKKPDFFVKESVRVRQITLDLHPVADETPDLIQQLAAKIVQDARQPGANFADLARRYSNERSARDGELPTYTYYRDDKNTLALQLQEAVFKLQPGEVSAPVASDHFIFIFKCEDHVAEGYLPLEKVRAKIENEIEADDLKQATENWLQKLRGKAFIQYNMYGPETAGK